MLEGTNRMTRRSGNPMFFEQTEIWQHVGTRLVDEFESRYGEDGLTRDRFGLVLVEEAPGGARGFAHRGDWRCYPCSLVKAFHLVHTLHALEKGQLQPHAELDRALHDMIAWSSNTATNYVIDLVTGTTGNTLLDDADLAAWIDRREALNRFFSGLEWSEFQACNITQKLMDDTRYGREAQYAGAEGENLNALTPLASARLFYEIFAGDIPLGPAARERAQNTLSRERVGAKSESLHYQVDDFLGGGTPKDVAIWSKAGKNSWTGDPRASYFKHDLIRIAMPEGNPLIAALMTQGKTVCEDKPDVFPELGKLIFDTVLAQVQQG